MSIMDRPRRPRSTVIEIDVADYIDGPIDPVLDENDCRWMLDCVARAHRCLVASHPNPQEAITMLERIMPMLTKAAK